MKLTCSDAVEGLWFQIVDALIQVGGGTFAVNLVHGCIGAENPLHQPFQLTVACEMISPQVSGGRQSISITKKKMSLLLKTQQVLIELPGQLHREGAVRKQIASSLSLPQLHAILMELKVPTAYTFIKLAEAEYMRRSFIYRILHKKTHYRRLSPPSSHNLTHTFVKASKPLNKSLGRVSRLL